MLRAIRRPAAVLSVILILAPGLTGCVSAQHFPIDHTTSPASGSQSENADVTGTAMLVVEVGGLIVVGAMIVALFRIPCDF